jgi:beta-glucosidase-like glycosyl hydrolase/CubicO group peptidase (beta-lactamase class C family)
MNRFLSKSVLLISFIAVIITFNRFISADRIDEKVMRLTDRKAEPEFLKSPSEWVDSVLDTLSIEQRIGQLIMVAAYSNNNKKNEAEITKLIKDFRIGGLVFFQGSPFKQAELTNFYQSISPTPLLIGMDAENGLAMRLDSTIRYPSQMMLGAIEDDRLIFDMGGQIARQLKRLGVHINFAPVVDINNNPYNPVINRRSFGEDLTAVSRKSLFYMIGLENGGIISVAKHFPGHGDTDADSHKELPVMNHSRERLDSLELSPFRELIYNGLSGIMTAHLHIPALDAREGLPSSLSEIIVDTVLRKQLGFRGLIFTDALSMRAITGRFKPVEAAKLALLAGNDILLMPEEVPEVIKNLSKMVKNGKISRDVIDEKCRRVLAAKYWAGLSKYKPVALNNLSADLNKPEYTMLQRKLTEMALTLLQNRNNLLPLKRLDTLNVASVVFSNDDDSVFHQTLSVYMPVKSFHITGKNLVKADSILAALNNYNLVIASIHATSVNSENNYGISEEFFAMVDSLTAHHQVIINLFCNPYLLSRFTRIERAKAIVVSYENSSLVQDLTAQAIFGATGSSGTIPVTCGNWVANKSGLKVKNSGRLRFAIPVEAGMSEDSLAKIDDIISKAIEYQAFPGCQVLVSRRGRIVFNKAYGTHEYNDDHQVLKTDLYDLASITKVAATTQAIMALVDEGCVGINQKLSAYLPYLENSNKKDIYIADILLHQAGLQSYIQFYLATRELVFKNHALITASISDANPIKIGAGQYLNRYTRFKSNIIAAKWSEQYPLKVADNIYISKSWPDTIYKGIAASSVRDKKEYLYSDLGFILLKQMIDSVSGIPCERLLDSVFYKRLGASSLCFNPLNRYDKNTIVPTEDDQLFRQQLIQGYVHDQRAAMLGGISGHAGLFGNALDLAKVFQMMLNNGEYGGERYISEETVHLFTNEQLGVKGNRRGLGFDKPEPDITKPGPTCPEASPRSFGHTGFTGTMVWVDPEYDLVYVFLSNRVNPDASNTKLVEMNVRTNIQQVIYHSIMDQ